MTRLARYRETVLRGTALTMLAASIAGCATTDADNATAVEATADKAAYFATIDVRRDAGSEEATTVRGRVFHDENGNGRLEDTEPGVRGVLVSNGRDVAKTDAQGAYALPVRDDMSVFVIQPSGWKVPTDDRFVPQFAYEHKPAGSPKPLRFGGLAPTGPIPSAINFPLRPAALGGTFTCAVLGDTQTYSNEEVGFTRDSLVDDLVDRGGEETDCLLPVGDVVGDDLGLIPRFAEVLGAVSAPQWWVHGNHDYDFDADSDADSADSWRRLWGPAYYAFEMGDTMFIALDNVVYPCGPDDNVNGDREFCVTGERKRYNARITDDQLQFVQNVLDRTDENKLIVFAHHIPFVSFVDQTTQPHQTDNVTKLYEMVEGRKALSLSGHTHTVENFAPGDSFSGWAEQVGVEAVPFRHLITGAVSGGWWNGDYDVFGVPMSLQRQGGPRGFVDFTVTGTDYTLEYRATGLDDDEAMWLSISTPEFRNWATAIFDWIATPRDTRSEVPPFSAQDLPDLKLLVPDDLEGGSWITANVWMGDSTTEVSIALNGGMPSEMIRTQQAKGEAALVGVDYADPFALQRQLTVARGAIQSEQGPAEGQGYAQGRRPRVEPSVPQPRGSRADRNMHLWVYRLPEALPLGVHTATVTVTRDDGEPSTNRMVFEVRDERPPRHWRGDVWTAFEDGRRR